VPKFTLQTYFYTNGVEIPFIVNGKLVWHLPDRNPLNSNTPAQGYVITGSSLNIKVNSMIDPGMKEQIFKTSKN
jgi:hypothetical protein